MLNKISPTNLPLFFAKVKSTGKIVDLDSITFDKTLWGGYGLIYIDGHGVSKEDVDVFIDIKPVKKP